MKPTFNKRKAFTLIELLIVIAIIGILFIVLVSKVDFATDKAKATGVQTDFRSFQVAIESVTKENAGLATFGWDTGDANGDRIRNSYDKGDTNKNGKQDPGEVFVGSKTYGETWTNVYTLTNPADADDKSAITALEEAINKNLDPKLHITIHDDLTITMANGAQDPWNTEYHGYYITNATVDNKDRGAIVIYSNGANQEFGSEHSIANGVVTVNVPGNNVYGKDDYGIAVVYTYVNGYGEVKTTTTGFSINQGGGQAGTEGTFAPGDGGSGTNPSDPVALAGGLYAEDGTLLKSWDNMIADHNVIVKNNILYYVDATQDGYKIVVPGTITSVSSFNNESDFYNEMKEMLNVDAIGMFCTSENQNNGLKVQVLEFQPGLKRVEEASMGNIWETDSLKHIIFPDTVEHFGINCFMNCFWTITFKGVDYKVGDTNNWSAATEARYAFNSLPESELHCNCSDPSDPNQHNSCLSFNGPIYFT